MTLREFGNWSLFILAIVVVAFTLLYLFRSSDGWRHNRVGRVYLVKSVVLSVILVQISASVIYKSDYWNRDYIRLFIYCAGIVAYLWMMRSLLREQHDDRVRRKELCLDCAHPREVHSEQGCHTVIDRVIANGQPVWCWCDEFDDDKDDQPELDEA